MAGRETRIPKGSVSHRRSGIHRVFSHIAHKRRNVRFKGARRVHTPPRPRTAHTAAHTPKHGVFQMGALSLPSERFARFGNPVGPGVRTANFAIFAWTEETSERSREPSERRRARCASPFRGAAVSRGRVVPLLFPSPHRWASRFCSAASLAYRKLSACSLVTAVRFLNRCSRRSMRETYPLEQRSDCRF